MSDKAFYPTILCREEGEQWVFDCLQCGETHRHGRGEGHRTEHCNSYPGGYIIKLGADND